MTNWRRLVNSLSSLLCLEILLHLQVYRRRMVSTFGRKGDWGLLSDILQTLEADSTIISALATSFSTYFSSSLPFDPFVRILFGCA
jgi:hypothetical protein